MRSFGSSSLVRQYSRGGSGAAGGDARYPPGVKSILLARQSTPDEVIAALRARVFACFTLHSMRTRSRTWPVAQLDSQGLDDIQILSAKPGWVSVRVNCRLITAERLMTFANELSARLPEDTRQE